MSSIIIQVILSGIVKKRNMKETDRSNIVVLMAVFDKVFWLELEPGLHFAIISLVIIETLQIRIRMQGMNEYTHASKTV